MCLNTLHKVFAEESDGAFSWARVEPMLVAAGEEAECGPVRSFGWLGLWFVGWFDGLSSLSEVSA